MGQPARVELTGRLPVDQLWGIASRLRDRLAAEGIVTVADFMAADPVALRRRYSVVVMRLALELQGQPAMPREDLREHQDQLIFSRAFSQPVTTELEMQQVLSIYAQKASARLTARGLRAGHVTAWCASGHFAAGPAAAPHVAVQLTSPTDDPGRISRAAQRLLARADFTSGVRYARAGVMLTDLHSGPPQDLLAPFQPSRAGEGLGLLLEQVNQRLGTGSVGLGVGGLAEAPGWSMKRELLSPRGLTHWDELPHVKIP